MSDVNVLCLRYSTRLAIAQFSSASQKEKPSENDIFNQLYISYSWLTLTSEHTYVILVCQRFYPTRPKNSKWSLVCFHTTEHKLWNNFGSDFLLCSSTDYHRYQYRIYVEIRIYEFSSILRSNDSETWISFLFVRIIIHKISTCNIAYESFVCTTYPVFLNEAFLICIAYPQGLKVSNLVYNLFWIVS